MRRRWRSRSAYRRAVAWNARVAPFLDLPVAARSACHGLQAVASDASATGVETVEAPRQSAGIGVGVFRGAAEFARPRALPGHPRAQPSRARRQPQRGYRGRDRTDDLRPLRRRLSLS